MTSRLSPGARFLTLFTAVSAALAGFVVLALALVDPYGMSPIGLPVARPIMDINQRFMYPQLARSGRFDSAVFGTSTLRLLDPEKLDPAFGGRFANLAMNAATPWEQLQLAALFRRKTPDLRTVIFGIDSTWCEQDADSAAKRLTFRAFPESFYDDNKFNDLIQFFNVKSIEIAGRLAGYHLGWVAPRIRDDGYENFLPPDAEWTPAYADRLLWSGTPRAVVPRVPPYVLADEERNALRFPAITWLGTFAESLPATTRLILVLPPNHIRGQPTPGTREAAVDMACRETILRQIGARSIVVDMRFANDLTRNDANYWDPVHFRLPIAGDVLAMIRAATADDATSGPYWRRLRP